MVGTATAAAAGGSSIVPALISGAASLASGIAGAVGSGRMNRRTVKYNKWALEQQMKFQREQTANSQAWSKEMLDYQNAYDSLSAQMQRAKEAGVNPYAVVSPSNASASGSLSSPDYGGVTPPSASFDNPGAHIGNALQGVANIVSNFYKLRNEKTLSDINDLEYQDKLLDFEEKQRTVLPRVDPDTGERVFVNSYKSGYLKKVATDLKDEAEGHRDQGKAMTEYQVLNAYFNDYTQALLDDLRMPTKSRQKLDKELKLMDEQFRIAKSDAERAEMLSKSYDSLSNLFKSIPNLSNHGVDVSNIIQAILLMQLYRR